MNYIINKCILNKYAYSVFWIIIISLCSCNKFLEIDSPTNQIVREKVFEDDATAIAAMSAVYQKMIKPSGIGSGLQSITLLRGVSSDELMSYLPTDEFSTDNVSSTNSYVKDLWADLYYTIYASNSVIEGLANTDLVTPALGKQLTGEAMFVRSFCYFYLVNLFGEVPYVIETDYRQNSNVARESVSTVYLKIIQDLLKAKEMLHDDYPSVGRVRSNKWAAAALLSRVYIYSGEWQKAELAATEIIENSLYAIENIETIFKAESQEAIWQLMSTSIGQTNNSGDGALFIPEEGVVPEFKLTDVLMLSFEDGDLRRINWTDSTIVNSETYHYAFKYRERNFTTPVKEHTIVFRLAEQYLIRAEARVLQNKTKDAIDDLNVIRDRAELSLFPYSLPQTEIFNAIFKERRIEFFAEWSHRWFDLKRTGEINAALSALKPGWVLTDTILPIPKSELLANKKLTQNPGYE